MDTYKILPSILASDHGRFLEEIKSVTVPGIDTLHIDIMDGHFVPNIVGGPQVVSSLKRNTDFCLDVHLMIENVETFIPVFAKAGADFITIHQEITPHLHRSISLIHDHGVKAGVALNPMTSIDTLRWVLADVELVLVMSVNPGFGGQHFIDLSIEKLHELKKIKQENKYSFILEVDGGIDEKTAPSVHDAGAEYLVMGNAIFGKKNRAKAIQNIRTALGTSSTQNRNRNQAV